jgi:DNA-directed RNA polymerase subunit L
MPSKKRVHLQQSGIISLAKSRSNIHQESWEKQVDLPNYWDNHKLCKWVGKSYKKLYCTEIITKSMSLEMQNHTHTHTQRLQSSLIHQNKVTMRPYLHDEIWKITHTQITIIIDTSKQGYLAAISSWRDMQNHTHTHRSCSQVVDLARTSSILLASCRSCCKWSLNKLHLCWWLRELIPGSQWDHKAF